MAVLGLGTSNGGCSLLHAAGLGYGASLALDLPVKVRLLDKQPKRELLDPDDLLGNVINAWSNAGHPIPEGDLFWSVNSKIPPRQGLKSSSAVSVAAIKALCEANEIQLDNAQIVDLLLESPGPSADDWNVIIVCRGDREIKPELENFAFHQQAFAQALNALQEGNDLVALTWNGRGVIGALNDPTGRKMTNDAFVNGARAAGISGSGSAIVIFVPSISIQSIERIKKWYSKFDSVELIETKVINADFSSMDE